MKRIAVIEGMHCEDCVRRVEDALKRVGYKVERVSLEEKVAEFSCGCTDECGCPDPATAISSAGYKVVEIRRV